MRSRLRLLTLAITSMIVLGFVIPLAILVRDQAADRAINSAVNTGESVAAALAVASVLADSDRSPTEVAEVVLGAFGGEGVSLFLTDGTVVGAPAQAGPAVLRAREGTAVVVSVASGAEVAIPVTGPAGQPAIVVRVAIDRDELRRGVALSIVALAALGVLVIVGALGVADRFARSVVDPVARLSSAARELGAGHLDVRVTPAGPTEIEEVGQAFNHLAEQLADLLAAERESIADLSHRLRTPLAALRLQADSLGEGQAIGRLRGDIVRMDAAVSQLIEEARIGPVFARYGDMTRVVRHRTLFWNVLAERERRFLRVDAPPEPVLIPLGEAELGSVIDALIENVFKHTVRGTDLAVVVDTSESECSLVVEDGGEGFPDDDVLARGASSGGSTGLGLDITRRAIERAGGTIRFTRAESGGARIEITLPRFDERLQP